MSLDDDVGLELMQQLRVAGQLTHSWLALLWQSRDTGVHPAAAMLLGDLAVHGECRPSELARRRMVDVSVISRQLTQLTSSGLVERRPAPEDGRAALIRVSTQGMVELERWRENFLELVRTALGDWSETEATELITRLTSMNEAIRAAMAQTPEPSR